MFKKTTYGFYSAKQVELTGQTIIYVTPTGRQVEVSHINEDQTGAGCLWDDLGCLGEIVDFVRVGQRRETEYKNRKPIWAKS